MIHMTDYDIIIIGAGLGGLVAGAKLAKEGKKVFLIEQHSVVGGCSSTFTQKGFTVDVGLHIIDGLDPHNPKVEIFEDLGVYEAIEPIHVGEFYRFVNENVDITIPDSIDKAQEVLIENFPDEKKAITRYFQILEGMYLDVQRLPKNKLKMLLRMPIFPLLYPYLVRWSKKTVADLLEYCGFKDINPVGALLANLGFYGDDPYKMSALLFGVAQGSYLRGGAYYLKGGSQKLSNHFAKVIEDNGGEILLNHLVTKIITRKGHAVGVEYRHRDKPDEEPKKAYATHIISDIAIPNLIKILPARESKILDKLYGDWEPNISYSSLYIGLDTPLKDLGNKHFSTFVWKGLKHWKEMAESVRWPYEKRKYSLTDYSVIDTGMSVPGKGVANITVIDNYDDWAKLSKEEYKERKERLTKILLDKLEELVPGAKEHVEWTNCATPMTIERFILAPKGTPLGFAQTPKQFMKRPKYKSKIPGLWHVGAWTFPGGGFTPAMQSGYDCAVQILKK